MPLKNSLFTVILVGGFFALAEILLALAGVRPALSTDDPFFGFAGNVPLYVEAQADDGSTVLRTAENKIVLFNHQVFPKTRSDNAYRIFCMGGSTTYGRPYRDAGSFCGWLRAYLGAADPGRDMEGQREPALRLPGDPDRHGPVRSQHRRPRGRR